MILLQFLASLKSFPIFCMKYSSCVDNPVDLLPIKSIYPASPSSPGIVRQWSVLQSRINAEKAHPEDRCRTFPSAHTPSHPIYKLHGDVIRRSTSIAKADAGDLAANCEKIRGRFLASEKCSGNAEARKLQVVISFS